MAEVLIFIANILLLTVLTFGPAVVLLDIIVK